jgi:predicted  nucleic acid-binding Zn-ribbon protein
LNQHLAPLIELQAIDLRVAEIKEQQRKTPELVEAAEAPFRAATLLLKETTATVEQLLKERRERERDLETHEAQVDKLKAGVTELKTNKEYQARLFEIEMANKRKGEVEEQVLLLMERIEAKQQEIKQAKARATEAERLFTQEKQRLEATTAALLSELSQLEQKQGTVAAKLDRHLLDRYNKLKATRKDLALAPVRNGTCFGCRLQLPPQLVAEVKRSEDLQTCSYCQRILYWEGEPVSASTVSPTSLEEDDVEETV